MEDLETRAINRAENPSRIWRKYVDDTFLIQKTSDKERFLEHINSTYPYTQITVEERRTDCSMPFLDTWVIPEPDRALATMIDRKPTHTDRYLQWYSHHNIIQNDSEVNTLQRAKTVCSTPQLLQKEEISGKHYRSASTSTGH